MSAIVKFHCTIIGKLKKKERYVQLATFLAAQKNLSLIHTHPLTAMAAKRGNVNKDGAP